MTVLDTGASHLSLLTLLTSYDANIVNDGSDLVYSFELKNKFVAGIAEAVSF